MTVTKKDALYFQYYSDERFDVCKGVMILSGSLFEPVLFPSNVIPLLDQSARPKWTPL